MRREDLTWISTSAKKKSARTCSAGAWFFEESRQTLWVQLDANIAWGRFSRPRVSWQVTPYEVRSELLIGFNFGKYLSRIDRAARGRQRRLDAVTRSYETRLEARALTSSVNIEKNKTNPSHASYGSWCKTQWLQCPNNIRLQACIRSKLAKTLLRQIAQRVCHCPIWSST
jgi:hypothetical protein